MRCENSMMSSLRTADKEEGSTSDGEVAMLDFDGDVEEEVYDESEEGERCIRNAVQATASVPNITKKGFTGGWFIPQMSTYHKGIQLSDGARFFAQPREEDQQPGDTPAQHPLRALAAAMDIAPDRSLIRVYGYSMTDPYFLALILHHSQSHVIQIILEANEKNVTTSKRHVAHFDATVHAVSPESAKLLMQSQNLQIRVADCLSPHYSRGSSSMHMKGLMTVDWTLMGSYNFSMAGRYKNWENIKLTTCGLMRCGVI